MSISQHYAATHRDGLIRRSRAASFGAVALLILFAPLGQATATPTPMATPPTFVVTSTADTDADTDRVCDPAGAGNCTLRGAIDNANELPTGATITFAPSL